MTHSSNGQITVTYKDVMGNDLSVVNAARVSFGKESKALGWYGPDARPLIPVLSQPDTNLINYLAKHKHMSPFGHAFASFHVKAPVFVARQLVKHKFLRWNEVSRRYVDDEPEFYTPEVWRGRSADKKQGSEGVVDMTAIPYWRANDYAIFDPSALADVTVKYYNHLIEEGVSPEQARMVLPQSTMTEWWWSGSLDAFADMCKLRLKDDTQYETRLVAQMIDKEMATMFPVSWSALMTDWNAVINEELKAKLSELLTTVEQAIETHKQPHYGDTDTELDNAYDAINLLCEAVTKMKGYKT